MSKNIIYSPGNLKEARINKGYGVTQLARESGVPFRTLMNYEAREGNPTINNLRRIARVLGVRWVIK